MELPLEVAPSDWQEQLETVELDPEFEEFDSVSDSTATFSSAGPGNPLMRGEIPSCSPESGLSGPVQSRAGLPQAQEMGDQSTQ